MIKEKRAIARAIFGVTALLVLSTCSIFNNGGLYEERNANPYRAMPLDSPQQGGDLNRLAFGVSSRRITQSALPVAVYTDYGIETNFRPWGNIIQDSDEDDPGFEVDPKKGAGRQIVITAINETNNAGKIAGSEDGISFYFKEVDASKNFRISADFYVDIFGFTGGRAELNGQEAFGFMARDYVPQHTDNGGKYNLTMEQLKNVHWSGVYWNGQDTSLNDGVSGSSNMIMVGGVKRGMRVYWRTGVTDPDGEEKPITDPMAIANADFAKFNYLPREFSDYSIYGSGIEGTKRRPDFPSAGLTYSLYLEKTNSGFVAKIKPPKGVGKGVTKDRIPDDGYELVYTDRELAFPDMLTGVTAVKKDKYYVGLFAARDAKVTITNLKYEEADMADCPPRIDPEPEPVIPTFTVQSPVASSVEDYTLYARSNVEGYISLSINGSSPKIYSNEWIVETTNASARPFSLFKVEGIKLKPGDNVFDMVFTPDRKQLKSGFLGYMEVNGNIIELEQPEYQITDTKNIAYSFIVNRRDLSTEIDDEYGRSIIWVAPEGRSTGNGTEADPLDIKTAIAVSAPGQMIMLKDGIYTPIDPAEMVEGKLRIPIRLIIPRYNSGLPNNDPGAPSAPQPRPASPDDGIPYPDPYKDQYYKYYKVLKAQNRDKAVFDFRKDLRNSGYAPRNFEHRGDYWIIDGIHVRNAEDTYGGFRMSGSYNLIRWVKTYFNGDSGLWISGTSDEPKSMWPEYNRVEYCESFGNADQARTNADGFASKLTTWEGNVFYRCISHHNIDDGYDLFAKKETGPIGPLHIEQCFAYSNGRYLNDEMGRNYSEETASAARRNDSAGVGGNGFKMGGEGIPVTHLAINCLSFGNDGDGFTSNSDPAIRLTHCTAFDNYNRKDTNPGSNYAIYSASSPKYEGLDAIITQVLSWRSNPLGARNDRAEPLSPSAGYVWRNYDPDGSILGLQNTREYSVYDGNNGKDSAILDMASGELSKALTGRSVSTLYVAAKRVQLAANGNVNLYVDNRSLTIDDFEHDPAELFSYGVNGENIKRAIFTDNSLSPWDGPAEDMPYRRLDGSSPPNRADGKIDGDFFSVWQEGDESVPAYYWGLPKLGDFMKLKPAPGTLPGAAGLWY